MATYTVIGHPIDPNDLGLADADALAIRNAIQLLGVGATITYALGGPDDTRVEDQGILQ